MFRVRLEIDKPSILGALRIENALATSKVNVSFPGLLASLKAPPYVSFVVKVHPCPADKSTAVS